MILFLFEKHYLSNLFKAVFDFVSFFLKNINLKKLAILSSLNLNRMHFHREFFV